jgi:hypothetical protein
LQNSILTTIEQTTQALYARQPLKENYVLKVLGNLQTIQLFVRMAHEEKLIADNTFFNLSERVVELNKWLEVG